VDQLERRFHGEVIVPPAWLMARWKARIKLPTRLNYGRPM